MTAAPSNLHVFWIKVKVEYAEITTKSFHFQHPVIAKQDFLQ